MTSPDDRTPSARAAALEAVGAVLHKGRPLDDHWAEALRTPALSDLEPRDRAFARALSVTMLRRLGQADAIIASFLDRPLPDKATRTRDLLRLGLAQIVFMGVAPHAAVNECVTLADASPHSAKHKNLINAVLRKASGRADRLAAKGDAAQLNTPGWLWESWVGAYGEETARAIAAQHAQDPLLDLTVTGDPEAWAERLEATVLPSGTLRRALADVPGLPGFGEGAWWVQDAAAALPVRLLGDVSGKNVIDLCAAPGGKTLQLASLGARVTALDRSANRLKRVGENLARTGLEADLVAADATTWTPAAPPDAILLDAPCSATGTIRRHPDVAWLKSPKDVASLTKAQTRLLDAALDMLPSGGVLVYCTCSLQPEEGPGQITACLARREDVRVDPVRPGELAGLDEALTPEGWLRTLPSHWAEQGGMDGFFAARLVKG